MNTRTLTIIVLITIAALSRLFPHLPNFTPLVAIALFSGAYITNRYLAMALPLAVMLISDALMGFNGWHFGEQTITVYGTYILITALGFSMQNNKGVLRVGLSALGGSVLFFITTNFAVWLGGYFHQPPLYSMNGAGLTQCYISAIPFLRNALAGDLFYNALLFGSFYLIRVNLPELVKTRS